MIKLPAFLPGPEKILQEGIIVLGGAILAAFVIGQSPTVRDWIKKQWDGTPQGF